jgi:hypothetical protein
MTARAIRRLAIAACGACIPAMILLTLLHHDGGALTFGLLGAVAVLVLMVQTSITRGSDGPFARAVADDEGLARRVEAGVEALVASGTAEHELRGVIRDAVALGQALAEAARSAPTRQKGQSG